MTLDEAEDALLEIMDLARDTGKSCGAGDVHRVLEQYGMTLRNRIERAVQSECGGEGVVFGPVKLAQLMRPVVLCIAKQQL